MISEKNENKRHCAKYIKNREQFCVFKQKQTISFTKYQVRCIIKPTTGYDDITLRHYNGRNGNGRKPYSMWGR